MPRFLKIFFAFLAGLVAGEAIPILWYIVATNYFDLFDRDGGGAMGAIFILGPILALLLGTVAALVTAIRTKAFSSEVGTGSREENASSQRPGAFSRFEEKRKCSRPA